ncbi:tricarballylate dehydrogenase [Parafrankia colletiae]|uniref:Tricarballylate dehydrogenase n=1 Tax=Parafrankia colletiae TaxID=573497 RepID=A0A1S1RGF9_9ACTN|nr:FAD-dependent tricarballylate dehydrogenase TcuA [Parafrankia colletiae]MCK9904419.1 FAD-dependent tricarballylate dehydrogenase TcuA [Frankia sp. Cpl3]OHV43326.1 tricarballylate dehydrogenase [Parafrankia colletiae]OHV44889.1 tricarballylate dehydrogenase [Parafrankia colletiae]
MHNVDVVVVGGGNAGYCTAHAAAERGRRVMLLEKAPRALSGGNSYYTLGATRMVHAGLGDLLEILEPDERHARTEVPPYSEAEFLADLDRIAEGRDDKELAAAVVEGSRDAVRWLHELGLRFRLMYERQAHENADGTFVFWGGTHVCNVDAGPGLISDHERVASRLGVEMRYGCPVTGLMTNGGSVVGVRADDQEFLAESVVIASGGFEANAQWRQRYLGDGWQHAKVRGTPYNTGDLIGAALEIGADRGGDWSTCHSVPWDASYPENESNRMLTNRLSRYGYPLGIVVNAWGRRFLDEGADFRNYTYAKHGKVILEQPGSVAFQIFDANSRSMLNMYEYDMPGISPVVADSVEGLAAAIDVDVDAFVRTVRDFNLSIDTSRPLDPTIKDGRSASVEPIKSNWASAIETPPYYAYPVTCGISFTFGGLRGDINGRVLDRSGAPIPGLFACGEALGGLFSGNYPTGAGLTAGMVVGRRTGSLA